VTTSSDDTSSATAVATGFSWPECPRWHDGLLYFCDVYREKVLTLAADGEVREFADLNRWRERNRDRHEHGFIGGLGFLPDGRLLMNRLRDRVVLVTDGTDIELYADLSGVAQGPLNDMVVSAEGRAYISQIGFDIWAGEELREAPLLVIEPDRSARSADEGGVLTFGNGLTLSGDGTRLVVAEAAMNRLTAFDVTADGRLEGRRVFADLDRHPDGICGDVDGAVWAAQPGPGGGCVRVEEGGTITDRVSLGAGDFAIACCLADDDRRTLYIVGVGADVNPVDMAGTIAAGTGGVWTTRVEVGGRGVP
jgi:sugar lactone lactonase YvrE